MNGSGAKRFMARLMAAGLNVDWLEDLRKGCQPSRKSGLGAGSIQEMRIRGIIKKGKEDRMGTQLWTAGPFLQDHIRYAESIQAAHSHTETGRARP